MSGNPVVAALGRRLRLGVIGGGPDSFIGIVHRGAATLDERFDVVAGVLSSDAQRSCAAGRGIGLAADRSYGSADEMLRAEARRADGIDALAIMTPNDSHYELACAALDKGLDVICEKPLTTGADSARDLVRRVRDSGAVFCVTYGYTGYPMVRQARAMVQSGLIGDVRMVQVNYVQGHLATLTGPELGEGVNWHLDPAKAGVSLVLGDIGTHAFHLSSYVTGLQPEQISADVGTVVPGREADDYASILMRLRNGARGNIWITQAAAGSEHGLMIRVFGEHGGLEWHQEHPNQLRYTPLDRPPQQMSRGGPGLSDAANRATRIAIGHPEGYREAFANLYSDAAEAMVARRTGVEVHPLVQALPSVEAGAHGVLLCDAALRSSRADGVWTPCDLRL